MSARRRWLPLLASVALLAGCRDRITVPEESPSPSPSPRAPAPALGVVEVTITGIGTPRMSASARFPGPESDGGRFALIPVPGSDGSIQLSPLAMGSFNDGVRGAGGVRYVQATFRVRNAD